MGPRGKAVPFKISAATKRAVAAETKRMLKGKKKAKKPKFEFGKVLYGKPTERAKALADVIKRGRKAATATVKEKGGIMVLEMTWAEVEQVIGSGAANRVLLYGPPGTGKSYVGSTLQKDKDAKVFTVTVTPEMSAAEIRGHFVPKGDTFQWIDGPGVAAWREGGRLVLNEIDQASSDVLTMLHVILDDPQFARLTLPNEKLEEVRPKAGFTVVATTNAENPQTVLPEALFDRFPVQIRIKDVNPKAVEALPMDLRAAAKELAAHADANRRIGIRAWFTYAELRKSVGEELAAKAVFGKRAMDIVNGLKLAGARA